MHIIKNPQGKIWLLKTLEISPEKLRCLNPRAIKILKLLKEQPRYPKEIAKLLKTHEQNIYYHVHQLESAGLIKVVKQERLQGTIAKFYSPSSEAFHFSVGEFQESAKLEDRESKFLKPFIEKGILQALIVVGSPDPHGPLKARSKDGYFGMDLALFLGAFIHGLHESKVRLDTEITEQELKQNNLIILGGPIVNKVANQLGESAPIFFDESKKGFYSKISKRLYVQDEIGIITKSKSPFNKDKNILYIAGIRNQGTKAAILAFLKDFSALEEGNNFSKGEPSKVVEGLDLDADGIIDSVEILE